ncbi:peptidoglycan recognition protein family protein [Paracidovorax valerianellae]|uniref:N-acetylmuramoyl-L-alanine amidase n=2 Tax=Paracidovorax valerianellae TaxID=187868 RepID=A0A1G6S4B4_9BURK|nr:peptidoglycan recognition family protein [Paracidovorax valerianellae]MDA8444186.1 N-acetylmuramoyl-L-alanine amidase [Paracidovorax valerianellae]SDD11698.1 N-acetylmuramoyl-L-alanine amidase [Paracidovorax valerianellae]
MKIVEGMIYGSRILNYRYPNLEQGEMLQVNGIILHQTNSRSAFPTLLAYYWRDVGAHFLIAPGGMIYQTARIDRVCHHVGMIRSMCSTTHSCSPDYDKAVKSIMAGSGDRDEKRMAIHKLEMQKPPQLRYPSNMDSIGIEVCGASKNGVYEAPTAAQNNATTWLVDMLLTHLSLKRLQVYKHPNVSYKEPTEASLIEF